MFKESRVKPLHALQTEMLGKIASALARTRFGGKDLPESLELICRSFSAEAAALCRLKPHESEGREIDPVCSWSSPGLPDLALDSASIPYAAWSALMRREMARIGGPQRQESRSRSELLLLPIFLEERLCCLLALSGLARVGLDPEGETLLRAFIPVLELWLSRENAAKRCDDLIAFMPLPTFSNGRLKLQVLPGGTIAPALEVTDAVAKGICEIGHLWPGYDIGRDATTAILGGWAGGMESVPMMHWLYTGGGAQLWRQFRLEKFGVVGIPCGIRPTEVFLHSHKSIRTLADLKGTKIRTVGAWADILPKLGASVVSLPGNEVFPALERKVIDATEWATPGENVISGFHEVAKYVIIPGAHQPSAPFEVVINKDKWATLPKDLQTVVEEAAMTTTFESWVRIGKLDMGAMEVFKKKGNEIINLDSETQTACLKLGKEWAAEKATKNEWFKKILDSMNAFEKSWENVAPTRYFDYKK